MMAQQLRRFTDKVDADMLRRWSDKANQGLQVTGEAAKNGINSVYTTAMKSPKASVAVVLGAGVAAAVVWLVKRTGPLASRRKQAVARVRAAPKRSSRRTRAAAA